MGKLPGFVSEAALKPSGLAYGAAASSLRGATIVPARIARRTTYGCGISWHTNEVCCRFWAPGGDIVVCCPRDGSRPCSQHPGLVSLPAG